MTVTSASPDLGLGLTALWVALSIFAASMQAVRTAGQKELNARLSTLATTYVRSVFGLPFLILFLVAVLFFEGWHLPELNGAFWLNALGTALTQIAATALLIRLFRLKNFASGTLLSKTDVMITAVIGTVFFSEVISGVGWIAIALTLLGVMLISIGKLGGKLDGKLLSWETLFSPATQLGLATGLCFALSYLFLREATLELPTLSFFARAGWTVVAVTGLQVVLLGLFLTVKEPATFGAMAREWKLSSFVGLTSALGSIGWFTAMAITNASYVKSVGQVETIFTILISTLYFRERIAPLELLGMASIVAGVLLFLW